MADNEPRLSQPTLKVLKLMLEAPQEARSGADLSKTARIGSGTMYPLLARLEKAGWIAGAWEEVEPSEAKRPRRRLYKLTGVGRVRARAAFEEFQLPAFEGRPAWGF